jgi:aminoglycoside phosphotransferase
MTESGDLPVFWSGRPLPGSVTVPPPVAAVAAGRPAVPVWVNEAGGLTFEVGDGAERCFVKWAPAGSDELDLAAEADRMEGRACRGGHRHRGGPAGDARQPAGSRWSGHVDLGRLGIADRWADLAIATWSAGWNYGPGWERLLLDAYGVEPDPERTRYYRLLWDLG